VSGDRNVDIGRNRMMDSALSRARKLHELVIYRAPAHKMDDSAARADILTKDAEFMATSARSFSVLLCLHRFLPIMLCGEHG
jgi:hypothetical protein